MKQIIDYKVYGLSEVGWKVIATLYDEELIRPLIDSLEDYSRVMVITYDYLNNQDKTYLVEDIEKNVRRRKR